MSDASNVARSLRERFGAQHRGATRQGALGPAREPARHRRDRRARSTRARRPSQAQEVALGALNIPSAADIERLTRRLRSVSQRLEGIEDGVDRLDTLALVRPAPTRRDGAPVQRSRSSCAR